MKTVLVILVLILGILQVRLWTGAGGLTAINRLENEIETQEKENVTLEARNQLLLEDVSDLKNGLDSIEERARSELGLIKKGETFFLIVEQDAKDKSSRQAEQVPELLAVPEAAEEINAEELLEIPPEFASDGIPLPDEESGL